ncbi:hypothetical protein P43SY_011942 [Pythium insidiosum]|uniref:DUF4345 domain-containing protein n=1 Tax=Pythium insidiosum TaxID=114742 RepID=A0AAD5L7P7_PYTIN|nr:hypothetical protein P43SY_011942 [Pythium insidiosum]
MAWSGIVVAVFFVGMGLYGLLAPALLVQPFGIELTRTDARNEVRAVYGGYGLAVGAALALLSARGDIGPTYRRGFFLAIAVSLVGMALGRVLSRLSEAPSAFYPAWFYLVVELVLAALLLHAIHVDEARTPLKNK